MKAVEQEEQEEQDVTYFGLYGRGHIEFKYSRNTDVITFT